jgi:hypothetical protein
MATTPAYPTIPKTWVERTDLKDVVVAADINTVYAEITSIENVVGLSPDLTSGWSGTWDNTAPKSWGSVAARLTNIEYGVGKVIGERVTINGGSTIQATTPIVGLTLKAEATSTANTVEFKTAAGTVETAVGPLGFILVIDGGAAN